MPKVVETSRWHVSGVTVAVPPVIDIPRMETPHRGVSTPTAQRSPKAVETCRWHVSGLTVTASPVFNVPPNRRRPTGASLRTHGPRSPNGRRDAWQCVSTNANAKPTNEQGRVSPTLFRSSAGVDAATPHHARLDVLHGHSPWVVGYPCEGTSTREVPSSSLIARSPSGSSRLSSQPCGGSCSALSGQRH